MGLGPLLLCIYASPLLKILRSCKNHDYAYNTQVYVSLEPARVKEACELVNKDLNNFAKAALDHCLLIIPSKINVILIGSNWVINNIDPHISSVKLSLIFDYNLRFDKHINIISL